jgi:hypothetical protein
VTRDVQYVIDGPDLPTPEVLTAIDRVADQLEPYPGWQIRVVIDPGTVIVATPAPIRPSEAPLSPEPGSDAARSALDAPTASQDGNGA